MKQEEVSDEQRAMFIANCHICILAMALRHCEDCKFKIGLPTKNPKRVFSVEEESMAESVAGSK